MMRKKRSNCSISGINLDIRSNLICVVRTLIFEGSNDFYNGILHLAHSHAINFSSPPYVMMRALSRTNNLLHAQY